MRRLASIAAFALFLAVPLWAQHGGSQAAVVVTQVSAEAIPAASPVTDRSAAAIPQVLPEALFTASLIHLRFLSADPLAGLSCITDLTAASKLTDSAIIVMAMPAVEATVMAIHGASAITIPSCGIGLATMLRSTTTTTTISQPPTR